MVGIVAGAVGVAGIATLSQLDRNPDGIGTENDPSPTLGSSGSIVIDIQRSSDETGDPEAIARLGDQEVWMCPDGWTLVNPDGTEDSIIFDCGQSDVFQAPVGTPIEVTGDFATLSATARLSASDDRPNYPAAVVPTIDAGSVVFYQYEASWNDESEASFWLLLTVQDDGALGGPHPGIVSGSILSATDRPRCPSSRRRMRA